MGEAAEKIVEGEWQGFVFRVIRDEDFEIVQEHIASNFLRDEPISNLLGFSPEFAEDVALIWRSEISKNLSILAIDKATNKVAGVRITLEQMKDDEHPSFQFKSEQAKKIYHVLEQVGEKVNIFEQFGVDSYADFLLVSVDREFRGRGLALELYERSVALLKTHGFLYVKCLFSSPYSRRNGEKLGFQELVRIKFLDLTNEDGETLLPNASPEQVVTLAVLKL